MKICWYISLSGEVEYDMGESHILGVIGKQDNGIRLELLFSEGREPRAGLAYWLRDPK